MKTRIIQTKVWTDNFFINLSPQEKLLFIYFLTNDQVNIIHLYQCPINRVVADTSIDRSVIEKAMVKFSEAKKIFFYEGYVFLYNSYKYEDYKGSLNEKAKARLFSELSDNIKEWYLSIKSGNIIKKAQLINKYKKDNNEYLHRQVAEKILGRKLLENEVVHHIDKNPANNSLSNLVVLDKDDHKALHKGGFKGVLNTLEDSLKGSINHKSEIINNKLEIRSNKYTNIKDLNDTVLQEIAVKYKVPLPFVMSKLDDMTNWLEAKGKRYKNYKSALMDWVKRDAIKIISSEKRNANKQGIDARNI
jgi:hypothetical protein